jgi:hypothetical protein
MIKKLFMLVLVLGLAGTASADLVGQWKLDGNALDSSVNGNNGTITSGITPTTDRFGAENSAMLFDGISYHYINVTDSPVFNITGSMTLMSWCLLDSTCTRAARIINKLAGANKRSWSINTETSTGGVAYPPAMIVSETGVSALEVYDGTTLVKDQWFHLAGVYTSGSTPSMKLYVNGVLVETLTDGVPTSQYSNNGIPVTIGNRYDLPTMCWAGKLDDVRIYNEALSGAEITAIAYYGSLVAWNPAPATGANNIILNTDLKWTVPTDSNFAADTGWTYKVYFGTNSALPGAPITIGPVGGGRLTATNAQIGGPLSVGTYYWRVDSVDPNGPVTRTGNLWTFNAGATLPTLISPADTYTPAVEIDVNLAWSSDPIVVTHNVVITPDGGSAVTLVNKTSPFNPYADPGITMEWNKQYTWQIKEYGSGGSPLAVGPEWHFKVRALNCVGMQSDIDGSSDCIVNLADFAMLASEWLDCNWDDGGKASPCP